MVTYDGRPIAVFVPRWEVLIAESWWLIRLLAALLGIGLEALLRMTAFGLWRTVRVVRAMTRDMWAIVGCVSLAGYFGYRVVSGWIADPRPFGAILVPPMIGLGLLAVLWVHAIFAPYTVSGSGKSRTTVRRTLTGKSEMTAHFAPAGKKYGPWMTCWHEGGHAAAAHHVGGVATRARVYADGSGYCQARLPRGGTQFQRTVNYIAFLAGGEVAVHSRAGCGHDQSNMAWALSSLPENQRSMARAAGYSKARAAQTWNSGVAAKVAKSLSTTGQYGSGGSTHYGIGGQ